MPEKPRTNWRATDEEKARIAALVPRLVEQVRAAWRAPESPTGFRIPAQDQERRASLRGLLAKPPGEELVLQAATLWLFSDETLDHVGQQYSEDPERWSLYAAVRLAARTLFLAAPVGPGRRLFDERVLAMLRDPSGGEREAHAYGWGAPQLSESVRVLRHLDDAPARALLVHIIEGQFDRSPSRTPAGELAGPISGDGALSPSIYDVHRHELGRQVPLTWQHLLQRGELDYPRFARSLRNLPWAVDPWPQEDVSSEPGLPPRPPEPPLEPAVQAQLAAWTERWATSLIDPLTPESAACYLRTFRGRRGARYLLRAAQVFEDDPSAMQLGATPAEARRDPDRAALLNAAAAMSHIDGLDEGEREDEVVAALGRFSPRVLTLLELASGTAGRLARRALVAHGGPDREAVDVLLDSCMALLGRLQAKDAEMAQLIPDFDPEPARRTLATVGDKELRGTLELHAKHGRKEAVMVAEALLGVTRRIEAGVKHRQQVAVRLLGLAQLPEAAAAREAELLRRYRLLLEFRAGSSAAGPERRVNEAACADAAMEAMAARGGYPDAVRLEWALEAIIAEASAPARLEPVTLGEYVVRVEEDAAGLPQLRCVKGKKTLARVPPAVAREPALEPLRAAVAEQAAQRRRFRGALERFSVEGTAVEVADLGTAARVPVAREALAALVLVDGAGRAGLYDFGAGKLLDEEGKAFTPRGPLRVVHAIELVERRQLGAWQRVIVERGLVQPFKQLFREVYLPTEAERGPEGLSRRFGGRVVRAHVLGGLIGERGWISHEHFLYRDFPSVDVCAVLGLADCRNHLTESPLAQTDAVAFFRGRYRRLFGPPEGTRLPVEAVPPRLFSEAMRDVDLFVSVARAESDDPDERVTSGEVITRRAELVAALFARVQAGRVTVDGRRALVTGRLAGYAVHLGTAAVYVEPGHHLCIIQDPSAATAAAPPRLPFFDGHDRVAAEIISKIFLLLDDDKVKGGIRGQIDAALRARR